jgi:hypothetical protein
MLIICLLHKKYIKKSGSQQRSNLSICIPKLDQTTKQYFPVHKLYTSTKPPFPYATSTVSFICSPWSRIFSDYTCKISQKLRMRKRIPKFVSVILVLNSDLVFTCLLTNPITLKIYQGGFPFIFLNLATQSRWSSSGNRRRYSHAPFFLLTKDLHCAAQYKISNLYQGRCVYTCEYGTSSAEQYSFRKSRSRNENTIKHV